MIQFFLLLLGLAFPNNEMIEADIRQSTSNNLLLNPGDTGGETGQTPPPKK
ncbi:hypothetical protein [Chryseobacterium luteum]|uniref:hypothetical protein n=1 Tax=Chryseobacterium luteum TaxID=421531 RepID=UPI000B0B6969|nr:hypothetical protein [Chryseobacterium luteum]